MNDLQWKTSNCTKNSILFYYFPEKTQKRVDDFLKRLNETEFQTCYVNIELDRDRVICLTTQKWMEKRESLCNEVYPSKAKKLIGVTGTNGKTTTVDIIRQLLDGKDKKVMTVGTLGVFYNKNKVDDFGLTTPDYIDLRKSLNRYESDYAVVEVSSHALSQNRFSKMVFDRTIWTSFSQDHLDYHGSMENYFKAKEKIVNLTKEKLYISESDPEIYKRITSKKVKIIKTKSLKTSSYFSISYNNKNLSLALGLLEDEGLEITPTDLVELNQTPGRFNLYEQEERKVVIDFAHTPDALLNVGSEIRKTFPHKKIITIFGCGGDRDRKKRPLMGKAACIFSDLVVITSDNPRSENALNIIEDIYIGCDSSKTTKEIERKIAIRKTMTSYSDAVFLIAGKGHENYIEIKGERLPYSDEEEVKRVLDDLS